MSIPKKIHYCWLSDEKMPAETKKCIKSWKEKMPEYELVLWDKFQFDITSVPFVEEACKVKKWAFAADYIRMYAIYTEGGIYLDTDVYVWKKFDEFLKNGFFTSMEYHSERAKQENAYDFLNPDGTLKNSKDRIFTKYIGIQAAILGGVKGHSFAKSCINWYNDKHFILSDGSLNDKIISPAIFADIAIDFGFRYKDELQKLNDDLMIYPSYTFAGSIELTTKNSYATHCCYGSWRDKPRVSFSKKLKQTFRENACLRKILGKKAMNNKIQTIIYNQDK